MSKYRAFLTPEEVAEFDEIVRQQDEHRKALNDLRPAYLKLVWKGRDRANNRRKPEDQAKRAREWAERFRTAAAEMPADPPADIDPVIWEAQRAAYLSQANDLEAQAEGGPT